MTDTSMRRAIIRDGMEFMVLVHRYSKRKLGNGEIVPHDSWGLTKFTPGCKPMEMHARPFATNEMHMRSYNGATPLYRHQTIGLFSTERKDELIAGWIEIPVPPEVRYYIHHQVTPCEWDMSSEELQDKVTVLVHE